ncbi:DUF6415 family natural product biosynthesis protein [Streptomyces seoulensis]
MTGWTPDAPVEEISGWLLSAAVRDADTASGAWAEKDVMLLRCGVVFDAVRVPFDVVVAAAGAVGSAALEGFVNGALYGAPVFRSGCGRWLFVLCEPGGVRNWAAPGAEYWGEGRQLGVPRPDLVQRPGRGRGVACWVVPPVVVGRLGRAHAVSQLVAWGRFCLAGTSPNPEYRPREEAGVDVDAACRLREEAGVDLDAAGRLHEQVLDLTSGMPHCVPPRGQLEPAVAQLRGHVEDLVRVVGEVIAGEEDCADRQATEWLLVRTHTALTVKAPTTDRAAAVQAEDLALCCRTLVGVHQRKTQNTEGGRRGE